MMRITFSKNAWEDYTSWQSEDKKMMKKINDLIKDIQRTPSGVWENLNRLNMIWLVYGQDELIGNTDWFTRQMKMKF